MRKVKVYLAILKCGGNFLCMNKTEQRYEKALGWMRGCVDFRETSGSDDMGIRKSAMCVIDGVLHHATLTVPSDLAKRLLTVRTPRRVFNLTRERV